METSGCHSLVVMVVAEGVAEVEEVVAVAMMAREEGTGVAVAAAMVAVCPWATKKSMTTYGSPCQFFSLCWESIPSNTEEEKPLPQES